MINRIQQGRHLVIALGGELDLRGAEQLAATVELAFSDVAVEAFDLDLSKLSFTDSAGLRAILALREESREVGTAFRLTAVSPPVERVIEHAGVGEILDPGH